MMCCVVARMIVVNGEQAYHASGNQPLPRSFFYPLGCVAHPRNGHFEQLLQVCLHNSTTAPQIYICRCMLRMQTSSSAWYSPGGGMLHGSSRSLLARTLRLHWEWFVAPTFAKNRAPTKGRSKEQEHEERHRVELEYCSYWAPLHA